MSHIFPGQDDSEVIQRVVYKHIFSVLPFLIVSLAIFLIGLFVVYTAAAGIELSPLQNFGNLNLNSGMPGVSRTPVPSSVQSFQIPWLLIGFGLSVIGGFMLLASIYVWRQNRMIMTSENVVDIDQRGVFRKDISTLRLSRVQDISVRVAGPMQTVFRYGTIAIQTAGEHENFVFDYIPNPYDVKRQLVDLFEEFVEHRPEESDGLPPVREQSEPDPDASNDHTTSHDHAATQAQDQEFLLPKSGDISRG